MLHKAGLTKFTQTEIRAFFKNAKALYKSPLITVLAAPIAAESKPKLLIITGRSAGSAVERNKVRRRIKTLYRAQSHAFTGLFICFIVKKATISYQQLTELFDRISAKLENKKASQN